MAETVPIESVAGMVQSFLSIKLDRESEQRYRGVCLFLTIHACPKDKVNSNSLERTDKEIVRGSISQLRKRLGSHVDRPLPASCPPRADRQATEIRNETPYRLGENLLPELKGSLQSLLSTTNSQSGTSLWYNSFLGSLVRIDELVGRIDMSITAIRIDHGSLKSYLCVSVILPFLDASRIASLIIQVKELFESELLAIFIKYDAFFDDSKLSNQSFQNLSTVKESEDLARLAKISIQKIDAMIQWLHKSMIRMVGEKVIKLLEMIDQEINWLLEDMYSNDDDQDEEELWQYKEIVSEERKDLIRAALPVIKLARIYFNKLARQPTDHVRLIFNDPSMHIGVDRSKQLFKETHKNVHVLTEFAYSIRESASQDNFLFGIKCLFDGVGASLSILKEYWRSLLESKDPGVKKELVKEAFQWLEFWSDQFFLANVQFILETANQEWL
ncbi:hypothetical protein PSTT_08988 [Puccinia striiformis]|uniref:Uncharacterized protein n=1 Tax=Puccinia striiformis TaxID=27350 RepID=A0A2S4VAB0_9BASI|nr:hypothetical protein PSTT_08988 [Puccinia striiformis]